MVEALLATRGIELTNETVRCWATKFGLPITRRIRSTGLGRGDKRHLDEAVVTINGRKHWQWRAVDQHDAVLDVLLQRRRDAAAAKRLMRKLLRRHGCPRVIVTDKLCSYAAASNEPCLNVEHRQHKGLNNRAENAHQPTWVREKIMRRFKSERAMQTRGAYPGLYVLKGAHLITSPADHRPNKVGNFPSTLRGKGTSLLAHQTPPHGEHSRLNQCPDS